MIFPLIASALVVVLNGSVLRSYNQPFVRNGRIVAPLEPYVTAVAGRMEYNGSTLVVTRGDRFAQIGMREPVAPARWNQTYVELAPVLRTLGVRISYDPLRRLLELETGPEVLVSPTPFNAAVPQASPSAIFTPVPTATPRPQVMGKPSPRRTPLPIVCCSF